MTDEMKVRGVDVPIGDFFPIHERKCNFHANTGYRKILASIREIGLIEPLCVFKENGGYAILDGFIRYKALQELGVDTVPCMVFTSKEAYTFNRMVNQLSHTQESRMLRKSLETLDEAVIARTLGLRSIKHKLCESVIVRLHPEVVAALDKNQLTQNCAMELTYVKHERQLEILAEMVRCKDYSISFARALVLRTPAGMRGRERRRISPWDKNPGEKRELVSKLEAIEKRYDFYSGLYRQYTTDLLRLCIYVRKLVSNDRVRAFLEENAPDVLKRFEGILFETQGDSADAASQQEAAMSPKTGEAAQA
jgi:hypothetical protein